MTIRLGNAAANAQSDAIAAQLNNGFLDVYTGTQPADSDAAHASTLIAHIPLAATAFTGAAVAGLITLVTPRSALALVSDVVAWGRFTKAGAGFEGVLDVSITQSGGGGDLIIDNVNAVLGEAVEVSSFTYTSPKT